MKSDQNEGPTSLTPAGLGEDADLYALWGFYAIETTSLVSNYITAASPLSKELRSVLAKMPNATVPRAAVVAAHIARSKLATRGWHRLRDATSFLQVFSQLGFMSTSNATPHRQGWTCLTSVKFHPPVCRLHFQNIHQKRASKLATLSDAVPEILPQKTKSEMCERGESRCRLLGFEKKMVLVLAEAVRSSSD
ncbi:hypothetical protein PG995_011782 [Apiospora arundinis]